MGDFNRGRRSNVIKLHATLVLFAFSPLVSEIIGVLSRGN